MSGRARLVQQLLGAVWLSVAPIWMIQPLRSFTVACRRRSASGRRRHAGRRASPCAARERLRGWATRRCPAQPHRRRARRSGIDLERGRAHELDERSSCGAGPLASAVRAGALAGAVTGAAPSTQRRIGPVWTVEATAGRANKGVRDRLRRRLRRDLGRRQPAPARRPARSALGLGVSATTAGRILAGPGCGAGAGDGASMKATASRVPGSGSGSGRRRGNRRLAGVGEQGAVTGGCRHRRAASSSRSGGAWSHRARSRSARP